MGRDNSTGRGEGDGLIRHLRFLLMSERQEQSVFSHELYKLCFSLLQRAYSVLTLLKSVAVIQTCQSSSEAPSWNWPVFVGTHCVVKSSVKTTVVHVLADVEDDSWRLLLCRCGCEECMTSRQEDSLRHSRSRINAYRALASPSLIALSSKDPILTAFELSWELRRLSFAEHEFKSEYLVGKNK